MQHLYEHVAGVLRQRIAEGTWPVGASLPSQTDLASEFGVARMTLQRAIQSLVAEGVLVTRQGSPMQVARIPDAETPVTLDDVLARLTAVEQRLAELTDAVSALNS